MGLTHRRAGKLLSVVKDIYVPPGGPPQKPLNRELYNILGEDLIRRMLDVHYRNLDKSEAAPLFAGIDMKVSAQKSADFFIQIMGGPYLYSQKNGPPRMRARHVPFAITPKARDVWLDCFRRALDEVEFPAEHRPEFEEFLDSFSAWMVNTR